MQVRTRLHLNVVFSVASALIIVIVILLALYRVNRVREESEIANQIVISVFERNTFNDDYLRTGNERAKEQWFAKNKQIGRLLESASERFKDAEEKGIIKDMIKGYKSSVDIFSNIIKEHEARRLKAESNDLAALAESRFATLLSMQSYDLVLNASTLRESASRRLSSTLSLMGWEIVGLIVVVSGAAITISLFLIQIISHRISRLRDGASVIGGGNLDYKIDLKGHDEFVDLAWEFNTMTAKLRESYEELKEEKDFSTNIINRTPAVICGIDPDGTTNFINPAGEAITGYSAAELIGKNWWSVFYPGDEYRQVEQLFNDFAKGNIRDYEMTLTTRDGNKRTISWNSLLTFDNDGNIIQNIGFGNDITERKLAEMEIRRTKDELQLLLETANSIIIRWTPDGIIRYINDYGLNFFGYSKEEMIGKSVQIVIPEKKSVTQRDLSNLGEKIAADVEGYTSNENENITKTGDRRWVMWTNKGMLDDHGNLKEILAIGNDITSLKRAEESLSDNKARLDLALRSAHMGVWYWDIKKNRRYFDDQVCHLLGIAPESFTGTPEEFFTVVHADDRENIVAALNQTLEQDVLYQSEYRVIWPDQSIHYITARGRLVRDNNGQPMRINGICWDVTDRMLAEEALRESENKLRLFIEHAPAAIAMLDSDMKYLAASRRWFKAYGVKEQDIIGRSHYDVSPDIPDRWKVIHRRVLAGSIERNEADPWVRADGHTDWIRWELRPWYTHNNEIGGLIIFSENISDLKRAEVALKENEERLKKAQEMAHLGSWELDLVTNVLIWSDEVYRIFGLEPQEFSATYEAFLERVHPDDRAAVEGAYSGSVRKDRDTYQIEHRVVRKNTGEIRYVHEKCQHMRDKAGKIIRSIGMVHDITELKLTEERILKLNQEILARNQELQFANNELESFIYSVSHDLRAPLRAISGFSQILSKGPIDHPDDKKKNYLDRIQLGAARMSQLIDDLLRLSHISRQDMTRTAVDLSDIAATAIAELQETNPDKRVNVKINEGISAFADSGLMKIVLSNLLDNAWKFTSRADDAQIEFGAVEEKGKTVYYVKDNGAGFNQEYADKMFRPFHRLHGNEEFEGTGIGLAIVERIIHRHGGRIWAEGEKNKGAVVYFTLG